MMLAGGVLAAALVIFAVVKLGAVLTLSLIALAVVLFLVCRWAFWPSHRLPRHRVRHLRWRLRLRLHPGHGHATVAELWVRWGRWAALQHGSRTRPSMSRRELMRAGSAAYSLMIGRAHYRAALRIPLQEHVLVLAPPRTGKSGWLARVMLRYPGPVLSTTTKHDVYEHTHRARRRHGPVAVFNPLGIGDVPSTFAWDPIPGCQSPAVAIRRADAFFHGVSVQGVEDSSFWRTRASAYLRVYFHAAAIVGGDLRLVRKWVLGADPGEAEDILCRSGGDQWWAVELAQLQGAAVKTIETIRQTMTGALEFMADPALAASVLPTPGRGLNIPAFLASSGTLYMIAESDTEDAPLAPLFAAFAVEVHKTATLTGSRMPGGRLDPPLLMALDEVTQICPVPLPHWLADSGGKGIQIIAIAHGEAQLRRRWQKDGARVVLDTSGVKIWLRGIDDPDILDAASKLCGTVRLADGDSSDRQPVMTADMLRQLPDRCALVLRSGLAPVIARLQMVWQDPLYKAAIRAERRPAVQPAPARIALPAAEHPALTAGHGTTQAPPESARAEDTAPASRPGERVTVPAETEAFPWSTR